MVHKKENNYSAHIENRIYKYINTVLFRGVAGCKEFFPSTPTSFCSSFLLEFP